MSPETGPNPEATPIPDRPHDFSVQKDLHRQIRNDPDYDDWEYGTEPLPQEAWTSKPSPDSSQEA